MVRLQYDANYCRKIQPSEYVAPTTLYRQTDRIAMPIAERTTYERAAKIGPNARQAVLVCLRCIAKLREGPPGGCFPVCHVGQL